MADTPVVLTLQAGQLRARNAGRRLCAYGWRCRLPPAVEAESPLGTLRELHAVDPGATTAALVAAWYSFTLALVLGEFLANRSGQPLAEYGQKRGEFRGNRGHVADFALDEVINAGDERGLVRVPLSVFPRMVVTVSVAATPVTRRRATAHVDTVRSPGEALPAR